MSNIRYINGHYGLGLVYHTASYAVENNRAKLNTRKSELERKIKAELRKPVHGNPNRVEKFTKMLNAVNLRLWELGARI